MSLLLVTIIVVLFYQVLSRKLFNSSTVWIEEFARYGNVWITLILFSIVIRRDENIRVDILDRFFRKRPVIYMINLLFIKLMELIFSFVLLRSILELLPKAQKRIIPGLGISMAYIYLSFVIGSVLCMIYIVEKILCIFLEDGWDIEEHD